MRFSGRIISAARALTGVSQKEFAAVAALDIDRLRRIEDKGAAWVQDELDLAKLARALDHFGLIVLEEADGFGAGVRLRFSRQDVRQIERLEGEGGAIRSDDAP